MLGVQLTAGGLMIGSLVAGYAHTTIVETRWRNRLEPPAAVGLEIDENQPYFLSLENIATFCAQHECSSQLSQVIVEAEAQKNAHANLNDILGEVPETRALKEAQDQVRPHLDKIFDVYAAALAFSFLGMLASAGFSMYAWHRVGIEERTQKYEQRGTLPGGP